MATVKGGLIKKQAAVQTEAGNGVRSIKDLVVQMGPQIAKALPTVLTLRNALQEWFLRR